MLKTDRKFTQKFTITLYSFKYSGTQLIGSPTGYENLAVIRGDHNYLGGKSMAGFHCIS